jgi:hypothetical protein
MKANTTARLANALAEILADRFCRIVPKDFHVTVGDDLIEFWVDRRTGKTGGRSGSWVQYNFKHIDSPLAERVIIVAQQALSELQDFIDEETTLPWPGIARPPSPRATLKGAVLHLWFEEGAETVLECEPIEFTHDWLS